MSTVLNYDPNILESVHVIEVTLCMWDYTAAFRYEVGGNCRGFDVLDDPAESLMDAWQRAHDRGEKIDGVTVVDDDLTVVTLRNPDGDTLECEIWDERELAEMIVAVRIVEVRRKDVKGVA